MAFACVSERGRTHAEVREHTFNVSTIGTFQRWIYFRSFEIAPPWMHPERNERHPPVKTLHTPSSPLRATAPAPNPGIHLVHSTAPVVHRDKFIRLPSVEEVTALKKSSIYAMIKAGTFPKPVVLSRRCSVWSEAAVLSWVQARIAGAQEAV